MLNVQVEGEWKQFPKGTRLIEACMKSGHFIPHYCYHPKLSSPEIAACASLSWGCRR